MKPYENEMPEMNFQMQPWIENFMRCYSLA